jgi:hypothetical protein
MIDILENIPPPLAFSLLFTCSALAASPDQATGWPTPLSGIGLGIADTAVTSAKTNAVRV